MCVCLCVSVCVCLREVYVYKSKIKKAHFYLHSQNLQCTGIINFTKSRKICKRTKCAL